jgi:hypothetical protein
MSSRTIVVALLVCLPMAAQAQEETPVPDHVSGTRFRWGVDGQAGYFLPVKILDWGASARFGAQLNDTFGVFLDLGYLFGIGIGGSVSSNGASIKLATLSFWQIGVMGEASLGDRFFIAAGPMLFSGGWTAVSQSADSSGNVSQNVVAAGDNVLPGLDLRIGVGFGSRQSNGRKAGFNISLDTKLLYAPVTSVSQSVSGSSVNQSVKVGDHQLGITPMLMLGYDAR